MKTYPFIALMISLVILLSGCGERTQRTAGEGPAPRETAEAGETPVARESPPEEKSPEPRETEVCPPNAIIDYIDFVMLYDRMYVADYENREPVSEDRIGEQVDEVLFRLSDTACTGHKTVNGDAAFLAEGTKIYAMKGYKPEFRVVADGRMYQAMGAPGAGTVGEFLDIAGKTVKVTEESTEDGSLIRELGDDVSQAFIEKLLALELVGREKLEKLTNGPSRFYRIHLKDGTSFRIAYWPDTSAFGFGAIGTEEIRSLLVQENG